MIRNAGLFVLILAAGCAAPSPARPAAVVPEPAVARAPAPVVNQTLALDDSAPVADSEARFVGIDRGGKLWVHTDDAEVRAVANEIARCGRINLIVDPSVTARVSIDLESVRAREALELIARASGCELEEYHHR